VSALLQHCTALQEELAADQGVIHAAEEKVGMNLNVMEWERMLLRDHLGKALGTTCLMISSVSRLRFWTCSLSSGSLRDDGRPLAT